VDEAPALENLGRTEQTFGGTAKPEGNLAKVGQRGVAGA